MLHPNEWPFWHDDPGQNRRLGCEVAPLRHDIALARYLEKQRGGRESTVRRIDLSTTTIHACVLIADAGRNFLALGLLPSERPKVGRVVTVDNPIALWNDRLD
ncbi:hypothetical protein [Mesorhizobium sp. M1396]|uniref:hypothetical protein n=1 Tax=Mesorhizobium sp. M1396 TaxID=2957095 RepID=UPI003334E464